MPFWHPFGFLVIPYPCCWEMRTQGSNYVLSTSELAQKGIAMTRIAAKIPHTIRTCIMKRRGKQRPNLIKCFGTFWDKSDKMFWKCQTSLRQILCKVWAISPPQIAPVVIVLGNRSPTFYLVIILTARTSVSDKWKETKKLYWVVCLLNCSVPSI